MDISPFDKSHLFGMLGRAITCNNHVCAFILLYQATDISLEGRIWSIQVEAFDGAHHTLNANFVCIATGMPPSMPIKGMLEKTAVDFWNISGWHYVPMIWHH